MNQDQARRIAHAIIDTWPTHVIKAQIWTDGINDLDYDTALGIYQHLRDHDEKPPSIARFRALYHSTQPDYDYNRPTDTGPVTPLRLGKQIAYQTYAEECLHQSRKPDPDWFHKLTGQIGAP